MKKFTLKDKSTHGDLLDGAVGYENAFISLHPIIGYGQMPVHKLKVGESTGVSFHRNYTEKNTAYITRVE